MLKRDLDINSGGWRERLRRLFGKRVRLEGETELTLKGRDGIRKEDLKRFEDPRAFGYGESIREYEEGNHRYRSSWNEFDNESFRSKSTAPSVSVYSRGTALPSSRRKSPPPPLPERRTPEPRTILRNAPALSAPDDDIDDLMNNRFSHHSRASNSANTMRTEELLSLFKTQTPYHPPQPSQSDLITRNLAHAQFQPIGSMTAAQAYAQSVNGASSTDPVDHWLTPHHTGSSGQSNNPFLRP